jgi:TonB family protein
LQKIDSFSAKRPIMSPPQFLVFSHARKIGRRRIVARASSKPVSYRMEPPSWLELTTSVDRAREISNASGAAIALVSDNPGELLCCARSGSIAPELGITSLVEESLTGRCIRSGKQLRCDDAQDDPRVCSSAAADLKARSLVATPLQQGTSTIGVLAVFSNALGAFSPAHLTELRAIADNIARILENEYVPAATKSKPPQPVRLPNSSRAPERQPTPEHRRELESPQPADALPQIPIAAMDRFPTLEAAAGRKKEPALVNVLSTVTVVLLVVTGSATWAYLKRTAAPSVDFDTSHPPVQGASTLTDKMPPKSDDPASPNTRAHDLGAAQQKPLPAATAKVPESESSPGPEPMAQAGKPAHGTLNGSARIAGDSAAASGRGPLSLRNRKQSVLPSPGPASSVPETPQLTIAGNTDLPPIDSLSKAAAPKAAPTFASDMVPARLIHRVPPQYPKIAQDMRVSGTVIVQAKIKKDGTVADLESVSGPPLLRQAAVDAVMQWEYAPASLNGQVIEQVVQIKLMFHPKAK